MPVVRRGAVGSVSAADADRPHAVAGRLISTRPRWPSAGRCSRRRATSRVRHAVGPAGAGRRPHGHRPGSRPVGRHPGLRRITVVGRALRANADARRAYAALARRRGFRRAAALGCGPAERLRRARAARRAPGPRDAPLSREPRGAADGHRRLPRRQAGRRHLPRRPGGGPGRRSRDGSLGAARPADHRTHLGARTQGLGHRPLHAVLGLHATTGPTSRSRASAGATCRCSRR